MLSSLNLGLKTQQYFVSSSDTFLDKKTLLEIWLNPGLNLTTFWGTGPCLYLNGSDKPQAIKEWCGSFLCTMNQQIFRDSRINREDLANCDVR